MVTEREKYSAVALCGARFESSPMFIGSIIIQRCLHPHRSVVWAIGQLTKERKSLCQPNTIVLSNNFFIVIYLTLLHLPHLRFHCVKRMLGLNLGLLRLWHEHSQTQTLTTRLDLLMHFFALQKRKKKKTFK
jgi:hypothetical protein